jgi:hypothetical protein
MTNKYLIKLAKTDIAAAGTGLVNTETAPRTTLKEPIKPLPTLAKTAGVKDFVKSLHAVDKLKLGMSATGLGLGATGFVESHRKLKGDRHRENLEAQSLTALNKIHAALAAKEETK